MQEIILSKNNITELGVSYLCDGFWPKLTEINLKDNAINKMGSISLSENKKDRPYKMPSTGIFIMENNPKQNQKLSFWSRLKDLNLSFY